MFCFLYKTIINLLLFIIVLYKNQIHKAISHAFRVIYEVEELATTGKLVFPLKNKDFIYSIKTNNIDKNSDDIINMLKNEMDRVEKVLNESDLPDKCDVDIKSVILDMYHFEH